VSETPQTLTLAERLRGWTVTAMSSTKPPNSTWRVVEASSIAKPGRTNEDTIVITDHYVAILDGTTAKHPVRLAGETPGAFASHHVAQAFMTLDYDATMSEAVAYVSSALAEATAGYGFVGREVEAPSCSLLAVSLDRNEIWAVGGGYARIGNTHHALNPPPSDAVVSTFRNLYQTLLLERGSSAAELLETDPAHELVMPVLSLQWYVRNHPTSRWGYGSIDGGTVPERYQQCLAIGDARDVAITSDGYLSAAATLTAAEAELASLAERDPLLLDGPGTRMRVSATNYAFDDRSYLRITR
jgi:hypothetical protein